MNKLAIIGISIIALLFSACRKDDDNMPTTPFPHTVLSSNISDLYETRGDVASDTVWIYVQGGPTTEREYALEETNVDGTDAYPFFTDDLRVYPFQVQQINDEFETFENLSLEQAKVESTKNAEIVKNVVEHLEGQNKIVYIIGHSYGSFIVNEVLAKYGPIGEKIASFNGRLDMEDSVWEGFSNGEEWLFDANGENPSRNSSADNSVFEQNMRKIAAGLGFNRYTEKLANVDLTNTVFVTVDSDEFVGDFTLDAISFLIEKEAPLIVLQDAGHGEVFEPSLMKFIHDDYLLGGTTNTQETFGIFTVFSETSAAMSGEIGDNTLSDFNEMIAAYPNINLINILEVPGSNNDEINLQVSSLVNQNNIATHLLDDGLIASGGVDFFLAGTTRTMGANPQVGVHSWGGEDDNGNTVMATDFPVGHEYHLEYIDYYVSIGFTQEDAEEFYYFTINAAPADDIYWMTADEIEQYNLSTD